MMHVTGMVFLISIIDGFLVHYAQTAPDPDLPDAPQTPEYCQVDMLKKITVGKKSIQKSAVKMTYKTELVTKNIKVGRRMKQVIRPTKVPNGSTQVLAAVNMETGALQVLPVGRMAKGEAKVVQGLLIRRVTENGVNSEYAIETDERLVVVALKTLVGVTNHPGRFTPVVYTPYSQRLNLPSVREAGMRYLLQTERQAYAKLKKMKVPSRIADSGFMLADIIPQKTIMTLLLIEHMDVAEFKTRGVEYMITKVLTTVGANGGSAYRYAVSEIVRTTPTGQKIKLPGARGLAQFIEPTYRDVVQRYPAARLKTNFVKGMDDHLNAVMAQVCLADRDLSILFSDVADNDQRYEMPSPFEIYTCYVAAAYNGGPERARHACRAEPSQRWTEGAGLAKQTVIYVTEFQEVYRSLFWE